MSAQTTGYFCDRHKCMVAELPCPHCGAKDHRKA